MNEDIEKASIIIVEMYDVPMHFYQSCACHTALMNHLKAHAAVRCLTTTAQVLGNCLHYCYEKVLA